MPARPRIIDGGLSINRKLFYAPKAPRPPKHYGGQEVQGYAIAIVIFAVAAVLLAIAMRIALSGI